jgi:hypothetical protein
VSGGGALDNKVVKLESLVRASYQECRNVYIEWCRTYEKQEEALRFATFSSNYIAMRQFTEKAGTELRLNKYADCTKDEYTSLVYGSSEAKTAKKKPADVLTNQRAEDARRAEQMAAQQRAAEQMAAQQRAAEQMAAQQKAAEQMAAIQRAAEKERAELQTAATQQAAPTATDNTTYGEYQDQYGRTVRPPQVVKSASNPVDSNDGGTPVIQKAQGPPSASRPTLVVPITEQQPPARPTEVIQRADDPPPRDTVPIDENKRKTVLIDEKVKGGVPILPVPFDPGAGAVPVRGTVVIKRADATAPQGTQVIRRAGEAEPVGTQVIRKASVVPVGTKVIKKGPGQATRGTQVIRAGNMKKESRFKFPFFQSEGDDNRSTLAPRGTIVIRKQIPEPAQNTFGLDSLFGSPNKAKATGVQETQVTSRKEAELDTMSSVFSFFGGEKKRSKNPRPVRGTILIPKGSKRDAAPSTVLIKKSDGGGVVPSIFSFFGGAKKSQEEQDDEKRPSITIRREADWTQPFSFLGGSREDSVESLESVSQLGDERHCFIRWLLFRDTNILISQSHSFRARK